MNRCFYRKWVVWLLPLLAVRAFLPVGFMWSAGPGGLELSFCPGQGSALVAAAAGTQTHQHDAGLAAQHHHDARPATQHHHGAGQGSERPDSPCPYGIAAVAMAGDVPHVGAALPEPDAAVIAPHSVAFTTAGPVRADRIRGPPSLS
jgi:hypothetical protein